MEVLCFGAYGNGNFGDMIQPELIIKNSSVISSIIGDDVRFSFTSFLNYCQYESFNNPQLPSETILDLSIVNKFDALIIGGGGLFSWPHIPLQDSNWVKNIKIPIYLISVGGFDDELDMNWPNLRGAEELIRLAVFVGGRDMKTVKQFSILNDNTHLMMDFALIKTDIPIIPIQWNKCWVIKPTNFEIFKELIDEKDIIISTEPLLEKNIFELMSPKARVVYPRDEKTFMEYIMASKIILSSRLHGAIYGIKCGKITMGICNKEGQSKVRNLFEMLNISDFLVSNTKDISNDKNIPKYLN